MDKDERKLIKTYTGKTTSQYIYSQYINICRDDIIAIKFAKSGSIRVSLRGSQATSDDFYIDKDQENIDKFQSIIGDEIDIPSEILAATMTDDSSDDDEKKIQDSAVKILMQHIDTFTNPIYSNGTIYTKSDINKKLFDEFGDEDEE